MAAASSPVVLKTPEEVLDGHARAMADICKRLLARVEVLERENMKKDSQLSDALDAIEELRARHRTKDEMIAELQALVAGKVAQ